MWFALAALLLLACAAPARAEEARITSQKTIAPRVVELTISTPAFTVPTHVDVDLPVGYDSEPGRRWPVAYFLAGTMNTYASFNSVVKGVELTKDFPAIVVSPNGDSGYWSDWYNGGALGPPQYETYVVDQLIPLIDANFRTIADRSQRAIAGVSMGGFGSMMIAAHHPDLFADAATLSGAVDSNLPTIGAAVTTSPTFQEAAPDSIFGPRLTQEVRWRGHNPTDLANNLRGLDLQVRTANGVLNTAIGEDPLSADTVSCAVEAGVHEASVSFNAKLDELAVPHLWEDYGPGCHTPPNFKREIVDTIRVFTADFEHPPAPPSPFDYESIEPQLDVWGWHVSADPKRALEFLQLQRVSPRGLTLVGSGTTTVTTPPLFRGARAVDLRNATPATAIPDKKGRIRFTVDLGPPDSQQEYTLGATPAKVSRTVTFTPHPRARSTGAKRTCRVPKLVGATLKRSRKRLRGAHCKLGKVRGRRARSSRVVRQHPKPGRRLPAGAKVTVKLG
jgi:S-formylglutathione hydrolase FrmB